MEKLSLHVATVIKAGRTSVFKAWTDPDLIRKWFAPGGMTVPAARADAVAGGSYSITMKGESNSPTVAGEYREVVANERLVFTWRWQGDENEPTLVTVTFKDVPEGTEVSITHERFMSADSRDRHAQGWKGCLENLAARAGAMFV